MPNGTYGGLRGKETKVGQKTFVSRPTRLVKMSDFCAFWSILTLSCITIVPYSWFLAILSGGCGEFCTYMHAVASRCGAIPFLKSLVFHRTILNCRIGRILVVYSV